MLVLVVVVGAICNLAGPDAAPTALSAAVVAGLGRGRQCSGDVSTDA